MPVRPVPEGFSTVTPYLIVKGANEAIEFYKKAFGAEEIQRMDGPNNTIMHAELQIGTSRLMMADEFPEMGFKGPNTLGGSAVSLHLYVEDVDAWVKRASNAGAKIIRPVADQFYGDRLGLVEDPFGHSWSIATHKEDLSAEQIKERAAEYEKQMPKS